MTTHRKTFLFPDEGIKILDWLKAVCHVSTDAEVVRFALGALSDLMIASAKGDTIVIRSADGERRYHPVFTETEQSAPTEALKTFRSGRRASSNA